MAVLIVSARGVILQVGKRPSGGAGGDLSGSYPDPTVAKVAGVSPGVTGLAVLASATQAAARAAIGITTGTDDVVVAPQPRLGQSFGGFPPSTAAVAVPLADPSATFARFNLGY